MRPISVFKVAWRSLQRAPVRSSLTALGVIVGVAAVVATSSIGNGAREAIEHTLAKPESRIVNLTALLPPSQFRRAGAKLSPADSLQPADYYAIREHVGALSSVSPRVYVSTARAQANGRDADITLEGIDVDGFSISSRRLLAGALFNSRDVSRASNVCVISESLARRLFSDQDGGMHIRLNGVAFEVAGIVSDVESTSPLFSAIDLHVYVPFTSLLRRIDSKAPLYLSAQAHDVRFIDVVRQNIDDVMAQRRSGRRATFLTTTSFDSIKSYMDGSRTVARLLGAVGAISLIVGGIGIMNIMLVSVKERTREIGLRMAVGTRDADILAQFLAEAIVLSLLGGTLGVAIGWITSVVITQVNAWPTSITPDSVLTALLCSLVVGVFFGYHPARQAASMQPVEALRAEN